jgi:hypothetical protein
VRTGVKEGGTRAGRRLQYLRRGVPVVCPRRSAVILHAPSIALLPLHLAMRVEPRRSDDGQTVEGIAEGVPDPRSALDGTHARQSTRGVGALASAGFEPLACATAVQAGIEPALFGGPHDHTGAKLASNRAIETRVSALSTEGRRPIDPTAHGLGRLAIGDLCDVWPAGHQRPSPRGFGGWSMGREQGGAIVMGDARAQRITPHEGPVPRGQGGPGDTGGLLGDGRDRVRMS